MFCPSCGTEYREGFTRCSDCDVDLVWEAPLRGEPDLKLVKVFETKNPALVGVIESLLDSAEIDFLTKIRGAAGGTFEAGTGLTQFLVRADDESAALELLAGIEESDELPPEE